MTGRSAQRSSLFITGTDTGVGKTRIACALLRAFGQRGERVIGMKPVAAGATRSPAGLSNDDVEQLCKASNVAAPIELVNPYCFEAPIAPHLAAAERDVHIDLDCILAAYRELALRADRVIVEGAGGFAVPLNRTADLAGLARALALPVVMVVGMRLGCLNHALLTAEAIAHRGLVLAGWVANCAQAPMDRLAANVDALRARLPGVFLGLVPFELADATRTAKLLDVESLGEAIRVDS